MIRGVGLPPLPCFTFPMGTGGIRSAGFRSRRRPYQVALAAVIEAQNLVMVQASNYSNNRLVYRRITGNACPPYARLTLSEENCECDTAPAMLLRLLSCALARIN